ncbi:hypothetical protein [Chryseobacterium limigenitum]|uniref:Uncharacterized protein n=1 Tax=Chryseobacterium limigenitum TaxID=1612149 RepID=A0A1K2IEK8_9FLAO|nr:hypothetical protein [Chryseobacterium limigenitum]SFZ90678.1 hypothetical protein SAMN05216324_101466 [Chryseobacterium limigenitum]
MKKTVSSIVMVISFFTIQAYAQVGIDTASPASTLDVNAKNATGATTNVDGMLVPRVDRQRAQIMTGIPTSTLIYINNATTGLQSGAAVNIDDVGYYYYNGTAWVKMHNPNNSIFSNVNIYNSDGSLTGNRIVTQAANTLAFTATATNAFSVDGSTLSVDAANDRLGIGTAAPTRKLHVEGGQFLNAAVAYALSRDALDINIGQDGFGYGNRTDNFGINMKSSSSVFPGTISRINFGDVSTGTAVGSRYLSFSVGITPNELMYLTDLNAGRVGIGNTAPAAKLDIVGTTFGMKNSVGSGSWDNIWFNVTPSIPSINVSGAESGLQFNVGANSVGTYGDGQTLTTVATMLSNGNMGVGTTTPAAKLHVEGAEVRLSNAASLWGLDPEGTSPTSQFSIIDRTNSVRRLILQENGNAYMGGALGTGGANATISAVGGSVGIGNNTAPTNTLDVNGTTRVRTITAVAGTTVVTPVYSDANGVLVKTSPSATYGGTSSSSVNLASGATGALISGLVDGGIYKILVTTADACGDNAIAEYYITSVSANSYFSINGLGGLLASGTTNKSPAFAQTSRNVIATTWTGKVGCSGGDNSTSLNYTLTVPAAGSINITNNGNITKGYSVVATRIN